MPLVIETTNDGNVVSSLTSNVANIIVQPVQALELSNNNSSYQPELQQVSESANKCVADLEVNMEPIGTHSAPAGCSEIPKAAEHIVDTVFGNEIPTTVTPSSVTNSIPIHKYEPIVTVMSTKAMSDLHLSEINLTKIDAVISRILSAIYPNLLYVLPLAYGLGDLMIYAVTVLSALLVTISSRVGLSLCMITL